MTKFPVYRKYTNNNTYFKILSENEFEELQFIGSLRHLFTITAHQYPERLRIMDMIACKDEIWQPISEDEYNLKLKLPDTDTP